MLGEPGETELPLIISNGGFPVAFLLCVIGLDKDTAIWYPYDETRATIFPLLLRSSESRRSYAEVCRIRASVIYLHAFVHYSIINQLHSP